METTRIGKTLALGVMVLALAGLAIATPALAGDDDILVQGSCSATSDWKLKVGTENNGLDVEFEVDQNVNDQTWQVRVTQNGQVIFQGTAVTTPPSGSFEVDLLTSDEPGNDRFVALARNAQSGERCRGSLVFPGAN